MTCISCTTLVQKIRVIPIHLYFSPQRHKKSIYCSISKSTYFPFNLSSNLTTCTKKCNGCTSQDSYSMILYPIDYSPLK